MGQGLSCMTSKEQGLFAAVQSGDLDSVKEILDTNSALLHHSTVYDCNSALHIAAANGQTEVLSYLIEQSEKPDVLNRHKQTPLMLAAMHGKTSCVTKLIEAGANILMFDSVNGRTCLHYAAYNGHSECLQVIISAARSSPVAASWGYARYVNVSDHKGATPLHLAARQRRPDCVRMLLENGALVCASTGGYGFPGSSSLHLAARSGSPDCIRQLLAWGADRLQRDASGRIPYTVALRKHHGDCAALLNPSSAEPLVWPSSLKFISELNHDAKKLLQFALIEANTDREDAHASDNLSEGSDSDLCGICFDQACAIEVEECGHLMCAQCTLALCCHNKPDPATASPSVPVCPFCRSSIVRLVAAKPKTRDVSFRKPRRSWRLSEGSSSFKGLSLGRLGRGSGRIMADNESFDKPLSLDL